jgi:class 3 adenylate cyclase
LLLFSNFTTNYITILLSRKETMDLTNQLLIRELKELYINAGNQYQIFLFSSDKADAMNALVTASEKTISYPNSWALGVTPGGDLAFKTAAASFDAFPDQKVLGTMVASQSNGVGEGAVFFNAPNGEYFGVYKYHEDWGLFLIKADLIADMLSASNRIFLNISIIIVALTIVFVMTSFFALTKILRFVGKMTTALYEMQRGQQLTLIDLKGAPSDDITYLGVSFNALSSTINNLLLTFRKFTSQDMVNKAYHSHIINLEGEQRELTVLFSDIVSFTYMTETLGNDIINLLNLHYDRAIHVVHEREGVIGSIIGDALLAIYGLETQESKSLQAVNSAWGLQQVAAELRERMFERRRLIENVRSLTEMEKEVFKVVLLSIGVGIDGGTVFYGTIGSSERMTSTVIGDNVNSASRLEGLTRIYHLPVIVSSYVKDEVSAETDRYRFVEIDRVQVKGKVSLQKIWYPLDTRCATPAEIENVAIFERGRDAYYAGDWGSAADALRRCSFEAANTFLERVAGRQSPEGWNGIWKMTTK